MYIARLSRSSSTWSMSRHSPLSHGSNSRAKMCLKSFQTNHALHVKHSLSSTDWVETLKSSKLVSYNSSTRIYGFWMLLDTFDPSYLSLILSKLHILKSFCFVKCSLATSIVLLIRFLWKTTTQVVELIVTEELKENWRRLKLINLFWVNSATKIWNIWHFKALNKFRKLSNFDIRDCVKERNGGRGEKQKCFKCFFFAF